MTDPWSKKSSEGDKYCCAHEVRELSLVTRLSRTSVVVKTIIEVWEGNVSVGPLFGRKCCKTPFRQLFSSVACTDLKYLNLDS